MLEIFQALRDLLEFFGWAITGGALGFLAVILGTKAAEYLGKKNFVSTNEYDFLIVSYNPLVPIIVSSIVVASVSLGLTLGDVPLDRRAWVCSIVSISLSSFITIWTYWFISKNCNNASEEPTTTSADDKRLPLISEILEEDQTIDRLD
mmetsp:Transcript_4472/g.4236  ORF Transcript_4472/g.4236 Transcript_4472/m.4236 type:complete len:149 (+) Transcript_4472:113-559(+)|eukprot:CAMPEP_0197839976 /NCGR_PEP_ID=MMETSP1437-20131217/45267_1 /TAXON_ID=49252 ORGANISM="Eucampia antarctica, Strain CCMP1452" /NCGR_SAMPLE_ID=MMETSP1437 /ASSEMBLY_ACC=CAM_ASM_001096 /LENGTH=148 /DNA_ID=CAMNT_0043449501 /DNA_START=28 /DNA_END=474 /DNA_ORIENTATION=+